MTTPAATPDDLRRGLSAWSRASRGDSEFDRGLSFVDAVYGFAATLLIANIDAPPASAWASLDALGDSGVPMQLLGMALSFTVIAVFWRMNVRQVARLSATDGATTFLGLVAAALVVLLPFTTQGISDPATSELALPTAFYAVNVALVALAQLAMFQVARARGFERHPLTPRENAVFVADALVPPVFLLLTVPVALLAGAPAARWSWLTLVALGPLSARLAYRLARPAA